MSLSMEPASSITFFTLSMLSTRKKRSATRWLWRDCQIKFRLLHLKRAEIMDLETSFHLLSIVTSVFSLGIAAWAAWTAQQTLKRNATPQNEFFLHEILSHLSWYKFPRAGSATEQDSTATSMFLHYHTERDPM